MNEIRLPPSVYQTIVTHALSHEKEEIMGLLIAEVCDSYIQIYAALPLRRTTRSLDRVEIGDEDMVLGLQKAEELGKTMQRDISVLGWYHSHPHITSQPSQHDLNTQELHEKLTPNFFGLIVSVFDNDATNKQQKVKIICFRSGNTESVKLVIEPVSGVSHLSDYYDACMETWQSIPRVLLDEISNDSGYCARFTKMLQLGERIISPMMTNCEDLKKSVEWVGST